MHRACTLPLTSLMAPATSGRGGSSKPSSPMKTRSLSTCARQQGLAELHALCQTQGGSIHFARWADCCVCLPLPLPVRVAHLAILGRVCQQSMACSRAAERGRGVGRGVRIGISADAAQLAWVLAVTVVGGQHPKVSLQQRMSSMLN